MLQNITQALQDASTGPSALPLAFALGLVSAMASACCTLPAMGMLVAYSGTRESGSRRAALSSSIWFLAGTTLALIIFGFVAGVVGQAAQVFLGRYWRLFAGAVAVVLGLATLKLLPLKLPKGPQNAPFSAVRGKLGAALGGHWFSVEAWRHARCPVIQASSLCLGRQSYGDTCCGGWC